MNNPNIIAKLHFYLKRIGFMIEELILLAVIILCTLDFFGFLPGDVDFFKKILSWTIVGYLIYKASPTKLFFGKSKKNGDLAIVLSLFLLQLKDFAHFFQVIELEEMQITRHFSELAIQYEHMIPYIGLFIGSVIVFLISFYFASRYTINKDSILGITFKPSDPPKNIFYRFWHSVIIFCFLITFYLLVYQPLMEWLALAVDNTVLIIGLLLYIFVWVKHHKRFDAGSFIFKVGNFGEGFIINFIRLFQHKRTFFLGVAGLLGLHLAVEVGTFIIPYVFGLENPFYFHVLGNNHHSIPYLLSQSSEPIIGKIQLIWLYLTNTFVLVFSFILPSYLWYNLYKKEKHTIPNHLLALFISSMICFLFASTYRISYIDNSLKPRLIGVDIMTKAIEPQAFIVVLSVIVFGLSLMFCKSERFKHLLVRSSTFIALAICGYYIYNFFVSSFFYYFWNINPFTRIPVFESWNIQNPLIFKSLLISNYITSIVFLISLFVILTFYVGGYVLFILETKKELRYVTNSFSLH